MCMMIARLTLEMPRPPLTPSPRSSHQMDAPAIPAKPVPEDHAPKAVRDDRWVGNVVVICKKVNSPNPEEREASEIPNSRGYSDVDRAIVCAGQRERPPDRKRWTHDYAEPADAGTEGHTPSISDLAPRDKGPGDLGLCCHQPDVYVSLAVWRNGR